MYTWRGPALTSLRRERRGARDGSPPITWLTGDLNLRARAMEADRYPVRTSAPPRLGTQKCARLNPMQTVPEEAAGSGVGWGEVFGMEEAGVGGGGVDAEGGFGDWDGVVGGWSDGEIVRIRPT